MEVHKHPHHVTHKKKWTEYLLEFFMLFLAVFLGFIAENIRENVVESHREKQYINSFYEDLSADKQDLERLIKYLDGEIKIADSIPVLMNNITERTPANLVYVYLRRISRVTGTKLQPNDRTIIQLRNAGGMRLIQNREVSDRIVDYYRYVEFIQTLNDESLVLRRSLREKFQILFNATDFSKVITASNMVINPSEPVFLRSVDANVINACIIEINNIKGINSAMKAAVQNLEKRATQVQTFIQEKYHIENK